MKLHQILLLHIATSILALFPSPIYAKKNDVPGLYRNRSTQRSEPYSAGKHHSISSSCIETWSRLDRSGRAQK